MRTYQRRKFCFWMVGKITRSSTVECLKGLYLFHLKVIVEKAIREISSLPLLIREKNIAHSKTTDASINKILWVQRFYSKGGGGQPLQRAIALLDTGVSKKRIFDRFSVMLVMGCYS